MLRPRPRFLVLACALAALVGGCAGAASVRGDPGADEREIYRLLIEDQEDLSSVGAKAGAYFKGAGPAMIGAGGVWENYLDCDETQYQNCTQFYPEFVISVSF